MDSHEIDRAKDILGRTHTLTGGVSVDKHRTDQYPGDYVRGYVAKQISYAIAAQVHEIMAMDVTYHPTTQQYRDQEWMTRYTGKVCMITPEDYQFLCTLVAREEERLAKK